MPRNSSSLSLLALAIISIACMPAVPAAGAIEESSAQDVVDYFASLFNHDWDIGEGYDSSIDGTGYAQSGSRAGSTLVPASPLDVYEHMTITPVVAPDDPSIINNPNEAWQDAEDAIIELIDGAQETLFIEQMYVSYDLSDLCLAILAANDRGVNVTVLVDDADASTCIEASALFHQHGIPVKSAGYPFDTQHNKGFIVDGRYTLVTSINLSPTSFRYNREAGVIIDSKTVAAYYTGLFQNDWNGGTDFVPSASVVDPVATGEAHEYGGTSYSGYMHVTALASPDNCFDEVNQLLEDANASIYISAYVLSSFYLMETLAEKARSGVDVRILLEKGPVSTDETNYNLWAMYNLTELNAADGKWATQSVTYQHCKYAVIDSDTLVISSGNWARASCPKPQDDGDVDGNRDWWFVVHGGEMSFNDLGTPGAIVVAPIMLAVIALATRNRPRGTARNRA